MDYFPGPLSTGFPAAFHLPNPPSSARASGIPDFLSVSAARALVSSAAQLQYVTTGFPSARSCSAAEATESRGSEMARGM